MLLLCGYVGGYGVDSVWCVVMWGKIRGGISEPRGEKTENDDDDDDAGACIQYVVCVVVWVLLVVCLRAG